MARGGGNAPKTATFLIALVLYLVALATHFRYIRLDANIGDWAWIIGFGLLLVGVKVRGL
ncbi:MAG: hypothetical protein WED01_07085 [Candidatus Rokuibacteriota bacterium]|jgi:hypothetical protein